MNKSNKFPDGYDLMTRLPSRQLLMQQLDLSMQQQKEPKKGFSVLMLGINNFNAINEIYGHAIGDKVLRLAARRLRLDFREPDMVGRYSGAVFCIVLQDCKDTAKIEMIANRMLALCTQPLLIQQHTIYLSVSIGASTNVAENNSGDQLIRQADMALRDLKKSGILDFRMYHNGLSEAVSRRLKNETVLFEAIRQQRFELHYQPVFDIDSRRLLALESLLRLKLENGDLVLPGEFISLAEETGLIVNIGEWVLREACQKLRKWRDEFDPELTMMVNVSARQLSGQDFVDLVQSILVEFNLPPNALELELTERQLIQDAEIVIKTLDKLRAIGVCISVDDFGTGYSSLAYLRRLPVDVLKIDRAFLKDVPQNEAAVEVVSSIIQLAKKLKLKVVVEGVETECQRVYLGSCSNLLGQGYHLAMPSHGDDIESRFLASAELALSAT